MTQSQRADRVGGRVVTELLAEERCPLQCRRKYRPLFRFRTRVKCYARKGYARLTRLASLIRHHRIPWLRPEFR